MNGTEHAPRSVWVHEPPDASLVASLARELMCPAWCAGLLVRRGISDVDAFSKWISPKLTGLQDPLLLPDMDKAVARILLALSRGERITIYGDYDVDGITACALVHEVLSHARAKVSLFLPHRLEEGYGLSVEALKRCIEETNPSLIITVDCGTSSADAVREAAASGIDVVITDHHAVSSTLAPAVAVVNPRRSPDELFHVLAGVGVAFKLCHALLKVARQQMPCPPWAMFDIKRVIDLVTLGTMADMVPLLHENRIFVSFGLREINRSPRAGIKALMEVAGITKHVGSYEIGFQIAPRLNAAGRLGTARASLELLTGNDPARLKILAEELNDANRARQEVEKATVDQLMKRIEKRLSAETMYAIVEADREWHSGVVGLAATRATQRFGRPSIIIGRDDRDRAKGSGRSIAGFNLVEALDACREHLVKHGGHTMAAGLEIAWENVEVFRWAFEQLAQKHLAGKLLAPRVELDGWISPADVDDAAIDLLEKLGPFGMGNPEPLWGTQNVMWAAAPREVGTGHLKGRLEHAGIGLEMIGFGLYKPPIPEGAMEAAFHLRRETFRGKTNIVMHVKHLRAHQ